MHGVHLFTDSIPNFGVPVSTPKSPIPTSSSPAPTYLIAGLIAGLVVGIAFMTFIALFVLFMRRRKSSTSTEQPFHDYVAPSQQPTLPERIKLEKNGAYGTHPHLTSSSSSLQYNAAYGVSEIDAYGHSELTSSLQSNAAYELQDNDAYETYTTPSLQSNAAYGVSKRMILEENDA